MPTQTKEHREKGNSPFAQRIMADYYFKYILIILGAGIPLFMVYLYLNALISGSIVGFSTFGWKIFTNTQWNPVTEVFGVSTFIYGTVITSFIAVLIALPLGMFASIFIHEYVPVRYKESIRSVIDVLAGIPSVIYGLWAIFVLIPLLDETLYELINKINSDTVKIGYNIFTASLILSIMILPILVNIIMEGFQTVPVNLREAMISLGATHWEVSKHVTIGTTKPTILTALMLGIGRALGETMAITMVIGNSNRAPSFNIFDPGQTIASLLLNEFGEATSTVYISVLFEIALVLFITTTILNVIGILIKRRLMR